MRYKLKLKNHDYFVKVHSPYSKLRRKRNFEMTVQKSQSQEMHEYVQEFQPHFGYFRIKRKSTQIILICWKENYNVSHMINFKGMSFIIYPHQMPSALINVIEFGTLHNKILGWLPKNFNNVLFGYRMSQEQWYRQD